MFTDRTRATEVVFECRLPDGHDGLHKNEGDQFGQLYLIMFADSSEPIFPEDLR